MNDTAQQIGAGLNKILLVESDPAGRDYIEALLDAGEYLVEIAGEGRSGIEQARRNNPDGIILSLDLPDMDGAEVVLSLRSDSRISRAVVSRPDLLGGAGGVTGRKPAPGSGGGAGGAGLGRGACLRFAGLGCGTGIGSVPIEYIAAARAGQRSTR